MAVSPAAALRAIQAVPEEEASGGRQLCEQPCPQSQCQRMSLADGALSCAGIRAVTQAQIHRLPVTWTSGAFEHRPRRAHCFPAPQGAGT